MSNILIDSSRQNFPDIPTPLPNGSYDDENIYEKSVFDSGIASISSKIDIVDKYGASYSNNCGNVSDSSSKNCISRQGTYQNSSGRKKRFYGQYTGFADYYPLKSKKICGISYSLVASGNHFGLNENTSHAIEADISESFEDRLADIDIILNHELDYCSNKTKYSWFEVSNLIPYEPCMRLLVAPKKVTDYKVKSTKNCILSKNLFGCTTEFALMGNYDGLEASDIPNSLDTTDLDNFEKFPDPPNKNRTNAYIPCVIIEYRWSHLFGKSNLVGTYSSCGGYCDDPNISDDNADCISDDMVFEEEFVNMVGEISSTPYMMEIRKEKSSRYRNVYECNSFYTHTDSDDISMHANVTFLTNLLDIWNPYVSCEPINMFYVVKLARFLRSLSLRWDGFSDVMGNKHIESSEEAIGSNVVANTEDSEKLRTLISKYVLWYSSRCGKYGSYASLNIDCLLEFKRIDELILNLRGIINVNIPNIIIYKVLLAVSPMLSACGGASVKCEKCISPEGKLLYLDSIKQPINYNYLSNFTDTDRFLEHTELGTEEGFLCNSITSVCPTVLEEYVQFGGVPVTHTDMELGIWIHCSAFANFIARDIPTSYVQQIQYSTRKYLSLLDTNEAVSHSRALNCQIEDEVCDGSVCDSSNPIDVSRQSSMDIKPSFQEKVDMSEINQDTERPLKGPISLKRDGVSSKLVFVDPYANVESSLYEDKDYVDRIKLLVQDLYFSAPDSFLAPSNGFYIHEDGYLVENHLTQKLRNDLYQIEKNATRTALLLDIIYDHKNFHNGFFKPSFLAKRKQLVVGKSKIHGYGLFAVERILKGEFILEYGGVIITDYLADLREDEYTKSMSGSTYLFRLDQNYIIDATEFGNCARFINHSCDPNTETTNFICVEDEGFGTHVGIYASRDIMPGEELFYNYRLSESSTKKEVCYCGTSVCSGYMSVTN